MSDEPFSGGFYVDENGKIQICPMKLPEACYRSISSSSSGMKSAERRTCVRRKFIPIEPMLLKPEDFQESPNQAERKPKLERHVRKELFTKKTHHSTNSSNVAKVEKSLPPPNGKVKVVQTKVKTVLFPTKKTPRKSTPKLRSSGKIHHNSDKEFLQLERVCSLTDDTKTASPIASFCAPLDTSEIDRKSVQEPVLALLKANMELFRDFQLKYESNMSKIFELLEMNENKENVQVLKRQCIVSPVVATKVDLRKIAIKNSAINETPRTKSALNLYNSLRDDFVVLRTPKLSTAIDSTQDSISRDLSRKIQKQCLLLQDTPRHE